MAKSPITWQNINAVNHNAANNLFANSANQVNEGVASLRALANQQVTNQQQQRAQTVNDNTQAAIANLRQYANPNQMNQNLGQDLAQYGNDIDMAQINEAANAAPQRMMQEAEATEFFRQQDFIGQAKTQLSDLNATFTPDMTAMQKVESLEKAMIGQTPEVQEQLRLQYANQLQVDAGLKPQFSEPETVELGGSKVMLQTNNITGQTKQIGTATDPRMNIGQGGDVFATDIKVKDADGNISQASKGKDGRVYDRNGEVVDMTNNTEVVPEIMDYHMQVLSNPHEYTDEQFTAAQEYIAEESVKENNRGQFSADQFVTHVTDKNNYEAEIQYLDEGLEIISLMQDQNASRIGSGVKQSLNGILEPMGMQLGESELNDLYALSESRKLEIVRNIVRAFAPVSDTAMNLTIEALEGKSFAQQLMAVKATRDSIASVSNANTKTAKELGVAEQYQGTTYDNWTKPVYESKQEIEAKTNAAIGNPTEIIQAPNEAIQMLMNDPSQEMQDYFMNTFGYLPEELTNG
ncbi:hypothetical protein L2735_14110 [Shewanella olleyana]|uniref:hypothetical protein n=1 Tax=Shewanella olleyana TaxID=135626 RepID=UPI00200D19FA|nr:hypothetical protein [Shewanella olleyana]MCL1067925.1 hypothetical protein [Shewanella olleyana]